MCGRREKRELSLANWRLVYMPTWVRNEVWVAESKELELRHFLKARTTLFTTSELEQTRKTTPFSKRKDQG